MRKSIALFVFSIALVIAGCSGQEKTEPASRDTAGDGGMSVNRGEDPTKGTVPGGADFTTVKASLENFCLPCHNAENKKGGVDVTAIGSADDLKAVASKITGVVESKTMPPANHSKQPTDAERATIVEGLKAL